MIYKEEVRELVFKRRSEISDLSEKKAKYIEKCDDEIQEKQEEIKLLDRLAETLQERQPPLPLKVPPGAEDVEVNITEAQEIK